MCVVDNGTERERAEVMECLVGEEEEDGRAVQSPDRGGWLGWAKPNGPRRSTRHSHEEKGYNIYIIFARIYLSNIS